MASTSLITIAVDGTSASGKGTLAKALAHHYQLNYLDSGLLYRYCGRASLTATDRSASARAACAIAAAAQLAEMTPENLLIALDDQALRNPDVAAAASIIAVDKELRAGLILQQRRVADIPPGAVLDGRDIGSVILPEAIVKFFVDADIDTRTERRLADYRQSGHNPERATLRDELRERDHRDSTRATAPLVRIDGMCLLDTTNSDIQETLREAICHVEVSLNKMRDSSSLVKAR